jgi:outer membrane protein OmpA-like peptidoglycan-associated protein
MKERISLFVVLGLTLATGGCATKAYVDQQIQPIQTKVTEVTTTQQQQGATLDQTRKDQARDETQLNATTEKANSADARSTDALTTATTADKKSDANTVSIAALRDSIDNYKSVAQTVVLFGINKDTLTADAKKDLDQLASQVGGLKHFYVAIEGFTDSTGGAAYNDALSQRRAQSVMDYLVGVKNLPVYRVQIVGLGDTKPVDPAHTRAARTKNRRVEVTIFSSDAAMAATSPMQ